MNASLPLVVGCVWLGVVSLARANQGEPAAQSNEHVTLQFTHEFDYLLYRPDGYEADPQQRWPLILFLHGAGERGHDLELLKREGLPKELAAGRKLPFVIVSPQCPPGEWWNTLALEALIDRITREHRIDPERIYLTGLSMGGFGVWALAAQHPERYAAILPICGGGERRRAYVLRDLPVWAFHGDADLVVTLDRSQEMIDAIKAAGGAPRFTIYPGVAHNSWDQTYANPEIYEWLLAHRRRGVTP